MRNKKNLDLVERIAEDVGLCYAVKRKENAILILCDLLYYTNLHTRWHQDTIEAIKGVCPQYFNGITSEYNKKDMSKDKIEKTSEVKSKILSNKAEAIAFMQSAGIYDEDGKLKEPYK